MAALLVKPQDAPAYAAMARCYFAIDHYTDAAAASQRAIQLDDNQNDARYVFGSSLMRLGRSDEGRRELLEFQRRDALAKEAEYREWQLKMLKQEASDSLEKQKYEEAVTTLEKALSYEPDVAAPYINLGVVLMRAGRVEAAIERFKTAIDLNASPDVHRRLADAYDALGRRDEGDKQRAIYERLKEERLRKAGEAR